MKSIRLTIVILLSFMIFGCSALTTKEIDKPVHINSFKKQPWPWQKDEYESVLLTPERRQILIKYNAPVLNGDKSRDIVCSEAPTDTGVDIDTMISTKIEGETPDNAKGSLDIGNQSNTANIALHNKAQSIKYMNSMAHAFCNMYMNGIIDGPTYRKQIGEFYTMGFKALLAEMPLFYKAISAGESAPTKDGASEKVGNTNKNLSPPPVAAPELGDSKIFGDYSANIKPLLLMENPLKNKETQ